MKKNFTLIMLAALLALLGCTKIEHLEPSELAEDTISFGTSFSNNPMTRAGIVSTGTLGVDGFGVNAYYTRTTPFSGGAELNYMVNTKVTYNQEKYAWTYTPVKYWPNNSEEMISFFAYGPYSYNPGDNNITQNATSLNFTVTNDVKSQVDLVYNTNYTGTIDAKKQATNEAIHFIFDHALSRVSFTVEAAVDETTNGDNLLDGNTRINIKKVALINDLYDAAAPVQAGPFYTGGTLSLLSEDSDNPWTATSGAQGFLFTAADHFYHTVKDKCAESGDEIDVIQLTRFNASKPQRVLNEESYLMIIPQEATFKIYIEYDVISGIYENGSGEIIDESAITNKITSKDALTVNFEKGKAYNFNLVLGMTSAKFDVDEVTAWDESEGSQDEWLPENSDGEPESAFEYSAGKIQIANSTDLAKARDLINSGAKYYINGTGDGVITVTDAVTTALTRAGETPTTYEYAAGDYLQVGNIDLSGHPNWIPIGNTYSNNFKGTYHVAKDGSDYYTIDGLTIYDEESSSSLGLFGYFEYNEAEIANINMTNVSIYAPNATAAAVVGSAASEEIYYCNVLSGTINAKIAAGIAGNASNLKIENCTNAATITGSNYASGITTYAGFPVKYCVNTGDITAQGHAAGISTGANKADYCSNSGDVSSTNNTAGGILGSPNSVDATIYGCYNTGNITAGTYAGGIIGSCYNNIDIKGCYHAEGAISGGSASGGIIGEIKTSGSNWSDTDTQNITSCYSTPTSASNYGGLIGEIEEPTAAPNGVTPILAITVSDCYYSGADKGVYIHYDGMSDYATKFIDGTHLWFGTGTPIITLLNSHLDSGFEATFEENGTDNTSSAIHPLILKMK